MAGLREYLLRDSKVVEGGKMDAAAEAWRKIYEEHGPFGKGGKAVKDTEPPSSNGTRPVLVEDVRAFRASLAAST